MLKQNALIIPSAIRTLVFLSDDKFLISENHRSNPQIQTFYQQVKKALDWEPEFVPLPVLNQHLENDSEAVNTSENQQKVIELFRIARDVGASDIHLEIGYQGVTQVSMRIHGDLEVIDSLEVQEGKDLASTIVLSMCDMAEKSFNENRPQGGRLASKYLEGLDLFGARYAHTPAVYGLFVVMRIIPDDGDCPPTLDELGFLPEQQALLGTMLRKPEGVVILSGPTGSGKSTTLRSFGDQYTSLTKGKRRLLTIEDPPEGKIAGVQIPIVADRNNPDAVSEAWVGTMTVALRLDPDGIIVGEIRCKNSAKTAVNAAMTGHLILTTLHSNDPFNILERLATLDIEPELIADPQLMIGLISQRLVQKLCPECRLTLDEVKDRLVTEDLDLVQRFCDTEKTRFHNPEGCQHCRQKVRNRYVSQGVKGRTVIAEVVQPDVEMMSLYVKKGRLSARKYWRDTLHGITRNQHLMRLVNQGLVDPLLAHSVSPLDEDEVFL
ncbi:GspE/PulE family protein (plasmid) [Citrobacter sp. OP27]